MAVQRIYGNRANVITDSPQKHLLKFFGQHID